MNTKRPNPKKDKSARRPRNELYWKTGGRQVISIKCTKKEDKKLRSVAREKLSELKIKEKNGTMFTNKTEDKPSK